MADQAEAVTAPAVPTEAPTNDNSKPEAKPAADAPAEAIVSAQEADDSKKEAAEAEAAKTNGNTVEPATTTTDSDPAAAPEDTEMKDDSATKATVAETVPVTPASKRKSGPASSKKKSSAVPEHKTKKLNRKKSKPSLHLDAQPGELYLARMKGHQPWPSIICDEEMLPQVLLTNRPVTAALPDGSFKRPEYADGGKRAGERTFPTMFLYTNEFAWIPNTELTPITPEECKEAAEKQKSKTLIEAYLVAAEGHDLAYYKGLLADHQQAIEEETQRLAEREAKKAAKEKRKSEVKVASEPDADEMEVDEEGSASKPKSKKRKKEADGEPSEEKPAKTPKTTQKVKLNGPKTPVNESATKKKATPKVKSTAKKPAAKSVASEDDFDNSKTEEKALTPAEAKEKKEKEIRYYRHKLQKGFLSRDTVPGEEEIKSMSNYLSKLEEYPDLEGSIIRATKIHKVLKAMIRLSSIPRDEEFNFKKRSHELLSTWNKILANDPNATIDKDDDAKPETNGVTKDAEHHDSAAADKAPAAAPFAEEKSEEVEKKIGTTVEGEKEAEQKSAEPEKATTEVKSDAPNVEEKPAEAFKPAEAVEASA